MPARLLVAIAFPLLLVSAVTAARTTAAPLLRVGGVASSAQDAEYPPQLSEGEVTLVLSPRWEDSALVVTVRANTHSVELGSLDLGALTRLVVGDEEIAPAQAGSLSGHHARATLIFRLKARPDHFAIRIRDVPDVPVRTLTWPEERGTSAPTP